MEHYNLILSAVEAEFGVAVRTTNLRLLRNQIYATLRKHPELPRLALIQPDPTDESILWLVRKGDPNGSKEN